MTARARKLRKAPTDAENKLWGRLRRDQINGLHFRRRHPLGPYTLDFYCAEIGLGIELDGGQHNLGHEATKDAKRTAWLTSKNISVIRFWNHDALANIAGVLAEIVRIAEQMTPSPTLPLSGGGSNKRRAT
jgi:very-short-patch-repair endonuclease